MVMDVTPSPQCVGREFVRQYYTLLNEAPQYLHRFYSNNSSFIHGGEAKPDEEEQKPVIGQTDIHKKIMSLDFKDCHAKIRYVDSQSTIGTGVVVQVTGELSNNQAPLRRFMQTFVLAPQTPNKYYVHNDIFRYQDEVFADLDEEEPLAEEERADNAEPGRQSPLPEAVAQPSHVENHPEQVHLYHQQMMADRELHAPHEQTSHQTPVGVAEPVVHNGHAQVSISPTPPAVQPEEPAQRVATPEPAVTSATTESSPEVSMGRVEVHPPSHHQTQPQAQQQIHQQTVEDAGVSGEMSKPRSWATIAHVSGGAAPPTTNPPITNPPAVFPPAVEPSGGLIDKPAPTTHRVNPMRSNRSGSAPLGDQRAFTDSLPANKPARGEEPGPSGDERRGDRYKYPDSQQVFVGNLPNGISEFELRDFFKAYGPVSEVRINRTSSNKLHFGFVVFESETVAQKVLTHKSLEYKNHRLNIEEKKPRSENRPHSNSRHGGRRDGQRHTRGRGFGGPRDDEGRSDQGRYNNLNKNNQGSRR